MNKTQYSLIKISINDLIENDYDMVVSEQEEIDKDYLIKQSDSLLIRQIARIRGTDSIKINELICVEAKKNKKKEEALLHILREHFTYNGINYVRFGKSQSQGKDGVTVFVDEAIFDELLLASQVGVPVEKCVISKYEAHRCLIFSSCTVVEEELPNIVIVDEYEKVVPNQDIRYVVSTPKEFIDKETGETKTFNSRTIKDGKQNIVLSPFDGCGCHTHEWSKKMQEALELDYVPASAQIRLPLIKGESVEVDFKAFYKELGIETITDVYGKVHRVEDIDCIWNTSMFKGNKYFKSVYGNEAWVEYMNGLAKYGYKLGISKYSHHMKNINLKTKVNFQYLQCLDIWNEKYVDAYKTHQMKQYDILDSRNDGNVVKLVKYSTELFEKIIKGDKFYTYKFLGIGDTDTGLEDERSTYLEAALINDTMLEDPMVKKYLYNKLRKAISQLKVGKVYADGFYHTIVGDMIGYLQYAAGLEPVGCLVSREFHTNTIPKGKALSFRSPLVCPSEVNEVRIVENELTQKWFKHFNSQDVCMINMYDLSLPQQGGADCDGDAVYLCHDKNLVDKKIYKPMIIDIEDKVTVEEVPYNNENITKYEINSRDNRIGEITNCATSIMNKYTTSEKVGLMYADFVSLLRILQGKEIDFLKTGVRWQMSAQLRRYLKQLPYFLMHNYPAKMKTYEKIASHNKGLEKEEKTPLNAYRSPSPVNELCDYVDTWEKKNILWNKSVVNTQCLIINTNLVLDDKKIIKRVRHTINEFASEWKLLLNRMDAKDESFTSSVDAIMLKYKNEMAEIGLSSELTANYVIKVSYMNNCISKLLAWKGYGDYIIKNLKRNSPLNKKTTIVEVPYETANTYEFLGKYYELIEVDSE